MAGATLVLLALGAGHETAGDRSTFGSWSGLSFAVASMAFATVGALVITRAPGNATGVLFCVTAVDIGLAALATQWADRALFIADGPAPGATAATWLQEVTAGPIFGLLALGLVLFPDGRLPSRRWRPVAWLAIAGMTATTVAIAVRPGPMVEPFERVMNPLGIDGLLALTDSALGFGFLATVAALLVAAFGLPRRMRRARGREREQLKWIAFAAVTTGVTLVAGLLAYIAFGINTAPPIGLFFAVFPIAAGIAILRHRFYDVDVVINRALVYGALTMALALTYLGIVLVLQVVLSGLTSDSDLAVAGSTLAVAALFRPARGRIQAAVDRRFYRRRYDAGRTLESFSAGLRDEIDLDTLQAKLRVAVADALQPAHVSLWLREAGR